MTAKEFLRQYRLLSVRIKQLDLDIMELEESYDSITIDYSGMPHGSGIADKTASLATQTGQLRLRKLQLKAEAIEKREEIVKVINCVEDPIQCQLLYDRYILFMTWERIAEDCDRSDKWCRTELHSRALQSVNKILDNSL